MKYDIYAIGNALVDTEIEVSDQFLADNGIAKGEMTLVDEARQAALVAALNSHNQHHQRASGGSACNTVVGASQLGAKAYYACRVADDDTGRFFVSALTQAGVDTNMQLLIPGGTSGKCLVMVTPDAERTMNTFLGISETVSAEDLDWQAVQDSRYVYIEGFLVTSDAARAATLKLRDTAKAAGGKVALTFSDPAMARFFAPGLTEMLGDGVDVLFCNREEAELFTGESTPEAALEKLKGYARSVVMTCGPQGALIYEQGETHKVAGEKVDAIDTNGAGDAFAGAYLFGLCQGFSAELAGELASMSAAQVVSQFGPRLSAADQQAVYQNFLARHPQLAAKLA